ncbi:ricin-type beta-trefoil lectin domain protein [Streptomyces sp. NPDC049040]|uniref:ricin-type beta-trefoil lectin domain protein n=1 Tax=Streptomyces sp. NPDC049040 TaxID=3365593 RepID=UPI0037114DAF
MRRNTSRFLAFRSGAVVVALLGAVLGGAVPAMSATPGDSSPYSTRVVPTVENPESATAAELAAAPPADVPPAGRTTASTDGRVQALSATNGDVARSEMIARAQQWVDEGVPYSQSAYWTDSNGTYRQDCSGFVSMAWRLDLSRTTSTLPAVSTRLGSLDVLQPGDMIDTNTSAMEHVVLFKAWTDSSHTTAIIMEEAHSGTDARVSQYSRSYLTSNGFIPYRYNRALDHPQYANARSGLCLSVSGGGSTADGAEVIQWTCNGGPEQQWRWNGSQLVNDKSGKCLSVSGGGSTAEGADVIQWTCNSGPEQQWSYQPHTGEWTNANGRCLSVSGGGSTTAGAQVVQWSSTGGDEQKWWASAA